MTETTDSRHDVWRRAAERAVGGSPAAAKSELLLFLEQREDLVVELDEERAPRSRHGRWCGLSVTSAGEASRIVYRSDPAPRDALALAMLATGEAGAEPRAAPSLPASPPVLDLCPRAARRAMAGLAEHASRAVPRARLRARWVGFEQQVLVARSGVPAAEDTRRGQRVRLEVRLERRGRSALAVAESTRAPAAPEASWIARVVDEAAGRIEPRLEARPSPRGERPVVFAPGVGGVLFHELVGHALQADAVLAGDTWLAEKGRRVGPEELTVVDDPRRGRAPWRVDDEGRATAPTALVRHGRVAGSLQDLRSSRILGADSSGHARRSCYRDPPHPRMGCTFVAAGSHTPEELLLAVDDGVYVRRMEAGHTDRRNGRALFRVTDADRIRNGRLREALDEHLLLVDGARALGDRLRIANDLSFDRCVGTCHEHGQAVPVSVGAPTIWIGLGAVTV